jgi:phosphomannomutase
VDENGDFVQPDYLVPIVARATLRAMPKQPDGAPPKVIHDIRTSRGAIEAIRAMGCEPVMVPVGHAFAKPILRQCGAVCGGELAGHYYFKEFFGCDSGVLAARRIISEFARAKESGDTFSAMVAPISKKYANSGELNFKVEDKEAAIARVLDCAAKTLPAEVSRSDMDGVRIEYAEGWINIRKSNTEPYLRLIAECDTAERLGGWIAGLKAAIERT